VISSSLLAFLIAYTAGAQSYDSKIPLDHPAIRYEAAAVSDPVSRLDKTKLQYRGDDFGYLPSVLDLLGIRVDSQALVFSKTSFQAPKISPARPRAIYFTDDAAVGFVRGGDVIELAAVDPRQGVVFYTLDARKSDPPRLVRQGECLRCHDGNATFGVPGMFVGSVFPNASGSPSRAAAIITDHRTAFEDRWGGWYVNARHGQQRDRSNSVAPDPAEPEMLDTNGARNLATLFTRVDTSKYLAPVSDIVALMTLEHQTQMINLMTRLGWESRMGSSDPDIEPLIAYMLFADEAPLREPVEGISAFTRTFPERGPRDAKGRSLRDFDLRTRLFRYPLSYMIYSAQFDALPERVRERIGARLREILNGRDQGPKFAKIPGENRRAILEILRSTKPGLGL
jgi:hypothetical protein